MKMKWKILIGLGIAGLFILLGCLTFAAVVMLQAPNINSIDATPDGYLTTILDDQGEKIDTLSGVDSNRIYVEMDQIPEDLQHAFVAIEDARFYKHNGIDIQGILRAIFKGVTTMHFSQGASTITQQLLKNNVFTDWMDEKTFMDKVVRKIQEQYLAIQLENRHSKEWILENYLNTINLGGGTRGVQVASQYYFAKDVSDLTLAESALLAGITKNPTGYNPLKHPEESKARQELVLKAMLDQGYIGQADYNNAMSEAVMAALEVDHVMNGTRIFSWFEDELINSIVEDLQEKNGCSEAEAWNLIYSGGLTIKSTQNTNLQSICQEVVNGDWYGSDEEVQTSIVLMDPDDGSVKAIVGGRGEKTASLVYNRASEAIRQPGSTLKILGEYAAGLDQGFFTLGTVFDDAPYTYFDGSEIHNANGEYNGTTTIRRAIASSCNIVALKAYQAVGAENVYAYLKAFGLSDLTEEDINEALAIGGSHNGVTNLQMAAAYNALAAGGNYTEPYYYTEVLDHDGNVLLQNTVDYVSVVKSDTAALLTDAMEDVLEYGTGVSASFEGSDLAGKSGTTNDNKDLWFVGYSPELTCSVWGGYDSNEAQDNTQYVKQIWKAVMEKADEKSEKAYFTGTDDMVRVTICRKCGKKAVSGLCNDTVQGSMTVEEVYASNTAPYDSCDCHVAVTICKDSGKVAGSYCPSSSKTRSVYLVSASQGTNDVDAVVPTSSGQTCDVHSSWWDLFLGSGSSDDSQQDETQGNNSNPFSSWFGQGDQNSQNDHDDNNDHNDHSDEGDHGWNNNDSGDDWNVSDWFSSWFR